MIVYGKQSALLVLKKCPHLIEEVFLAKEIDSALFSQIAKLNKKIIKLDSKKAQAMSKNANHQGILFKIKDIALLSLSDIKHCNKIIVLSALQDIGNIGQIVRTSLCLGIEAVVIADRTNLDTNALEGIFRASSGAALFMKIAFAKNSLDIANELKLSNFTLIGSVANNISHFNVAEKWALFMGSECSGMTNRLVKKMDQIIGIEMKNDFDSLNVGVAAGILIHELMNKGDAI